MSKKFEIAYSTRFDSLELTRREVDFNWLMRRARQQTSTTLLPSVGPSTALEDAVRNGAFDDDNRLTFLFDKARRAAAEHVARSTIDEDETRKDPKPPVCQPSLNEEDLKIVL